MYQCEDSSWYRPKLCFRSHLYSTWFSLGLFKCTRQHGLLKAAGLTSGVRFTFWSELFYFLSVANAWNVLLFLNNFPLPRRAAKVVKCMYFFCAYIYVWNNMHKSVLQLSTRSVPGATITHFMVHMALLLMVFQFFSVEWPFVLMKPLTCRDDSVAY